MSPQQNYIQEDNLISPEPVQVNHEVSEEQVTPIMEQGMTSGVSFVEEIMKDNREEDLIFKNLDIPWFSNQDLMLPGEMHMDSKVENIRKVLQQYKSNRHFLNESNSRLVTTNKILREDLEDINAHYQELIAVSKEEFKRKREIQNKAKDLTKKIQNLDNKNSVVK